MPRSAAVLVACMLTTVTAMAQSPGAGTGEAVDVRVPVVMLVNVGQVISVAYAGYTVRTGHPPASLDVLVETGFLRPGDLHGSAIVRPGAAWRLTGRAGPEAEIDLSTQDPFSPECRSAAVQAGGRAGPAALFGCIPTKDGVAFRFRL